MDTSLWAWILQGWRPGTIISAGGGDSIDLKKGFSITLHTLRERVAVRMNLIHKFRRLPPPGRTNGNTFFYEFLSRCGNGSSVSGKGLRGPERVQFRGFSVSRYIHSLTNLNQRSAFNEGIPLWIMKRQCRALQRGKIICTAGSYKVGLLNRHPLARGDEVSVDVCAPDTSGRSSLSSPEPLWHVFKVCSSPSESIWKKYTFQCQFILNWERLLVYYFFTSSLQNLFLWTGC